MSRRPGVATQLIEGALELACGLMAEERQGEEEWQRRRARLQRLEAHARALTATLTALLDQPQTTKAA